MPKTQLQPDVWAVTCRNARRSFELRPGERGFIAEPADALAPARDSTPEFTSTLVYPENITIQNLLYFVAAPTLCYQVCCPRCKPCKSEPVFSLVAVHDKLCAAMVWPL